MIEQELIRLEKKALANRILDIHKEVDRVLKTYFKRKLWPPHEASDLKLYTLYSWSQQYKVSLEFVVRTLVGHYDGIFRWKKKQPYAIGVGMQTMVGSKSRSILKDIILHKYPADEHILLDTATRQRMSLATRRKAKDEDGLNIRPVTLLGSDSADAFVENYRRDVMKKRKELHRAIQDNERRLRPYRDNPWRQ